MTNLIKDKNAQDGIGIAIFVFIAIIFALVAVWGFLNLNVWAIVIGIVGEIAWFFIFWIILR